MERNDDKIEIYILLLSPVFTQNDMVLEKHKKAAASEVNIDWCSVMAHPVFMGMLGDRIKPENLSSENLEICPMKMLKSVHVKSPT